MLPLRLSLLRLSLSLLQLPHATQQLADALTSANASTPTSNTIDTLFVARKRVLYSGVLSSSMIASPSSSITNRFESSLQSVCVEAHDKPYRHHLLKIADQLIVRQRTLVCISLRHVQLKCQLLICKVDWLERKGWQRGHTCFLWKDSTVNSGNEMLRIDFARDLLPMHPPNRIYHTQKTLQSINGRRFLDVQPNGLLSVDKCDGQKVLGGRQLNELVSSDSAVQNTLHIV